MMSSPRRTLLHPIVRELFVLLLDVEALSQEAFFARLEELELQAQSEGAPLSTLEAIEAVRLTALQRIGAD